MNKLLVLVLLMGLAFSANAKELKLKHSAIDLKNSGFQAMGLDQNSNLGELNSKYFVVQFENVITQADRKELESAGFEVLQYLPDDAYIVSGTISKAIQFKNRKQNVYEIAPYLPEWKLSSELMTMSVLDNDNRVILNLRLLPKADLNEVVAEVQKTGANVLVSENRYIAVESSKLNALNLANIEGIEFIQVQPEIKTFELDIGEAKEETRVSEPSGYESGTKVMNFDTAWKRGFTGQGQMVAMADTGLDMGSTSNMHKDLQTVVGGEAVGIFGMSWEDPQGHGTHVAGSVVSRGVLSQGLIKGGAFNANFYAQGMWSSLFNNITVPQDLPGMFVNAYNKGARVHTNSWGAMQNLGAYDNFAASVDEVMWNNQDYLIVFAAGNSGEDKNKDGIVDLGSVSSPGTAKNVLTVGASENFITEGGRQSSCGDMSEAKWGVEPLRSDKLSNDPNGIACFSSRGPTQDQRLKPDVVAPGTNIVSLQSRHSKATKLWGAYNEHYSWAGGTSMATPLTAGAAAVVREYLQKKHDLSSPSAALVKATLMHSAADIFPGQFGKGNIQEMSQPGRNNQQGAGRVDMDSATKLGMARVVDNKVGLGVGESESVTFNITERRQASGGILKATLVYTDAPGAASSGKALVNDLDIKVTAPDGRVVALNDRTNNSEIIEIADLLVGKYEVTVSGVNVPQGKNGKQPYALLVSFVKNLNN